MITNPIQDQVEAELAEHEPEVEVLLAEVLGGHTLRVFIDHPNGVTLGLCERVSAILSPLRTRYALEVSSPGTRRPLTKPVHFRRYLGRRARVRTRGPLLDFGGQAPGAPGGRRRAEPSRARSVTGELLDATDSEITLAVGEGVIAIPYSEISRSNLVEH
jgi:ribosome maturation factor RimP